jgi:hypothetical protein
LFDRQGTRDAVRDDAVLAEHRAARSKLPAVNIRFRY